ncbi:titin-like [Montipora capricornis]|uniref:titin-like n=1 Tax=Montipora capricornis TaxID=246305 RepID=UPI0035F1415A
MLWMHDEVLVMKTFRLILFILVCSLAAIMSFATASQDSVCTKGPYEYKKGDRKILDCDFADPAVRDILWFKDNKPLVNGSEGLYQSLYQLDDGTRRSSLLFPVVRFDHAGRYTCKTEPRQLGDCPNGKSIHILVECGNGFIKAYATLVSVKKFSNVTLRCSAMAWQNCFFGANLTWYHGNEILENNTKYSIRKQNTNECKNRILEAQFFLEISNVTDADAGEYVCKMQCSVIERINKDFIKLLSEEKPEITESTPRQLTNSTGRQVKQSLWFVLVVCSAVLIYSFAHISI